MSKKSIDKSIIVDKYKRVHTISDMKYLHWEAGWPTRCRWKHSRTASRTVHWTDYYSSHCLCRYSSHYFCRYSSRFCHQGSGSFVHQRRRANSRRGNRSRRRNGFQLPCPAQRSYYRQIFIKSSFKYVEHV